MQGGMAVELRYLQGIILQLMSIATQSGRPGALGHTTALHACMLHRPSYTCTHPSATSGATLRPMGSPLACTFSSSEAY